MLTNLYVSLSLALATWGDRGTRDMTAIVAAAAVAGVAIAVGGFLYLVARLSWAARQCVATCRERQRAESKMIETLRQYLGQPGPGVADSDLAQIWSASAAMAVC